MLLTRVIIGSGLSLVILLILLMDHRLDGRLPVDLVTVGVTLIGLLGMREFFRLCRRQGLQPFQGWTYASVPVLAAALCWQSRGLTLGPGMPSPEALGLLLFFVVLLGLGLSLRRPQELLNISVSVFGMGYVWLLFSFVLRIRYSHFGIPGVLLFLAVVKISDVSAYLVGRKWGNMKLVPSLSPGKSVQGALASLAATVVSTCVIGWLWLGLLSLPGAVIFGLAVGVVAQFGDLVESMFKRASNLKDSAQLLPEYGGVLDVLDSLLVSAPVAYLLLLTLGAK